MFLLGIRPPRPLPAPVERNWNDDFCRRCGDYLDPEQGRSICTACSTPTGAPA